MSTLEDIGEHDHTFLFPEERTSHLAEHQQLKEEQEALEAEKEEEENDEKKGDFDTLNMYMQYLFITLVPIFILLILSSVGVINQTGAAIIIVAILVVMMLINYRSIAKALAEEEEEEEEEEPAVAHYHDGQGRMYTGEQIFNDPYNPTTTTGSTTTGSTTTTSGPIDQITCPNGKYVWQNYLDKYGLLRDSGGNDVNPPHHLIKEFRLVISKTKDNAGQLTNPVQIDEIELFKYAGSNDPDAISPVYTNDDGITNIMVNSSITIERNQGGTPTTVQDDPDLMRDLSLNTISGITETQWHRGYMQTAVNPQETIKITLTAEQNWEDLYALVIYTNDDQCLGGTTLQIRNHSDLLQEITLELNANVHIIKFGAAGDSTTIETRSKQYLDSAANETFANVKREYTMNRPPADRQEWAVMHYGDNTTNRWDCTTETFTNMPLGANYSSKTLFSNDDLPKKIKFN